MAKIIFKTIQWLICYRRSWLRVLTWITRFGYWLFILYGILEWFRPGTVKEKLYQRRTLLYCLAAVGLGSAISFLIGRIWSRPRPFVQGDALALVKHEANASFPSNHAMNSFAVSLMLLARHNKWGFPALLWMGVLASSRVLSGLHYLSDIIGGFCLGAAASHIVYHSKRVHKLAGNVLYGWHILAVFTKNWWDNFR